MNTPSRAAYMAAFADIMQQFEKGPSTPDRDRFVKMFTEMAVEMHREPPSVPPPGGVSMPRLLEPAAQFALNAKLTWFDEELKGGAHTWVMNGGEVGKAAMAFTGDTRADEKLLEQIRIILTPQKGLSATGGFQDQKQLGTIVMFTLAKNTPRIWNRLKDTERSKIEDMVYGALVSSVFVTTDANPFLAVKNGQRDMLGLWMSRDWNPNYQNGFVGNCIVIPLFFGIEEAKRRLKAHDHAAFVAGLEGKKLFNLHDTFANDNPDAPKAAQIDAALHADYLWHGIPMDDSMGMFVRLCRQTFRATARPTFNKDGTRLVDRVGKEGGYTVNPDGFPNKGKQGMLSEFDTKDGSGVRSSAHYSNDGWYVNHYIHYLLLALGAWKDSAASNECLDRIEVGTEDLRFKIDPDRGGGYVGYRHGRSRGAYLWDEKDRGHTLHFDLNRIVMQAHDRQRSDDGEVD